MIIIKNTIGNKEKNIPTQNPLKNDNTGAFIQQAYKVKPATMQKQLIAAESTESGWK